MKGQKDIIVVREHLDEKADDCVATYKLKKQEECKASLSDCDANLEPRQSLDSQLQIDEQKSVELDKAHSNLTNQIKISVGTVETE